MAVLFAALPVWFVATWLFVSRKGATVGQYVMGLGILNAEDQAPRPKRVALYLVALHPLLFHPVIAVLWFLFAWLAVTLAENELLFTLCVALAFINLAGPFVNLGFILADPERRGIHDRLAGQRVVRL
jgi:uncharacterized RDD family membrane protein YckC